MRAAVLADGISLIRFTHICAKVILGNGTWNTIRSLFMVGITQAFLPSLAAAVVFSELRISADVCAREVGEQAGDGFAETVFKLGALRTHAFRNAIGARPYFAATIRTFLLEFRINFAIWLKFFEARAVTRCPVVAIVVQARAWMAEHRQAGVDMVTSLSGGVEVAVHSTVTGEVFALIVHSAGRIAAQMSNCCANVPFCVRYVGGFDKSKSEASTQKHDLEGHFFLVSSM